MADGSRSFNFPASQRSRLSPLSSRIVSSCSFAAVSECGIYADHSIAMLPLVCLQSLCKHFRRMLTARVHQVDCCSAHSFRSKDGSSNLKRQFQAPAERKLSEIQRGFSEPSDFLSGPNEARSVLVVLNQLLCGSQPDGRIDCRIFPCENHKGSPSKSQFVSKPQRDDCIKPACVSPLPYQWSKQRDQYANHCPHRSPRVPPDDAAVLPRRPARAESIPPVHPLIPLWIARDSATTAPERRNTHG